MRFTEASVVTSCLGWNSERGEPVAINLVSAILGETGAEAGWELDIFNGRIHSEKCGKLSNKMEIKEYNKK